MEGEVCSDEMESDRYKPPSNIPFGPVNSSSEKRQVFLKQPIRLSLEVKVRFTGERLDKKRGFGFQIRCDVYFGFVGGAGGFRFLAC